MKQVRKIRIILVVILLVALATVQETRATFTAEYPNPILFVHGLGGSSENFNIMVLYFRSKGWPDAYRVAHDFPDPMNCSDQALIADANMISQWVTGILSSTGAQKVDIIAHSMGGMSSRYYLKFLNGTSHVDDFVSLGSPHHGALPVNEFLTPCCFASNTSNRFVLELNEGDETPGGYLMDETGDRYDSILNITYNGTHVPGDVNYTAIYSRDDAVVTPYNTSRLEGANNIVLGGYSHNELVATAAVFEYIKRAIDDGWIYTITTTATSMSSSTAPASAAVPMIPLYLGLAAALVIKKTKKRKQAG